MPSGRSAPPRMPVQPAAGVRDHFLRKVHAGELHLIILYSRTGMCPRITADHGRTATSGYVASEWAAVSGAGSTLKFKVIR